MGLNQRFTIVAVRKTHLRHVSRFVRVQTCLKKVNGQCRIVKKKMADFVDKSKTSTAIEKEPET